MAELDLLDYRFGCFAKELRERLEMDLLTAAKRLKITPKRLGEIEMGIAEPGVKSVEVIRMADCYGADKYVLLRKAKGEG